MKTFCFKLYHSDHNNALMRQINIAGLLYNHCIALHKRYYRLFSKSLDVNTLKVHLMKLKGTKRFAYIANLGSQAVQDIAERIDHAYNLFFANLKRKVRTSPPKFKAVRKYKSFTLKQAGWKLDEAWGRIRIGKKWYGYFQSRKIEGKVKTLTVKRDAVGDIYVYLVCDTQLEQVKLRTGKSVGFDFGLKKFLTGSDGHDIVSPDFFMQNIKAIKVKSRKLSRRWGRKIHGLGFSEFLNILEYEAKKFGTQIIFVPNFYPSSQLCSICGYKNLAVKDLKVREWTCPECGTHHDRDRNAAKNIHRAGAPACSGDVVRPVVTGSVDDARITRHYAR